MISPAKFTKALSYLRAKTRSNVESNQIMALMALRAAKEGLSVGETGDAVGISHVSASRMLRVMGSHGLKENKEKGWGLVELYYDPERPRATMAKLNAEGAKVVDNFLKMLSE